MTKKRKIAAIILVAGAVAIGIVGFLFMNTGQIMAPGQRPTESGRRDALASVIAAADRHSGIEDAALGWQFAYNKANATNFGIMKCEGEVRCERVVAREVAVWMPTDASATDMAEVDTETHQVVSFQRSVPDFAKEGDLPTAEIESRVRAFLTDIYSEFTSIEAVLTFEPGMKGIRLNNGHYFFRWNDEGYAVPDGLSMDIPPFIQVGITASGFIFSYTNTLPLYHEPMWDDLQKLCPYIEMPRTDDIRIDMQKGRITVYFTDRQGANRYLLIPVNLLHDFPGCTDSVRAFLYQLLENGQI